MLALFGKDADYLELVFPAAVPRNSREIVQMADSIPNPQNAKWVQFGQVKFVFEGYQKEGNHALVRQDVLWLVNSFSKVIPYPANNGRAHG